MPTVTDKLAKIKHLPLHYHGGHFDPHAKMNIFEKLKKEGLGAPHELLNPKKLRIWTNQK